MFAPLQSVNSVHVSWGALLILLSEMNQGITRYSDVTWLSWYLKLGAIRLLFFGLVWFVFRLFIRIAKKISTIRITGPLWGESQLSYKYSYGTLISHR